MSKHKYTTLVCRIIVVLMLALTVLFVNGEAIGIKVNGTSGTDAATEYFSASDLDSSWDEENAVYIHLSDDGSTLPNTEDAYLNGNTVTIAHAGTYVIDGELSEGQLIVDSSDSAKIQLVLNGVTIHCSDNAAILINQAGKVTLTLAKDTQNTVTCGTDFSETAVNQEINGVIFSKDDLTINGSGSLTVVSEYQHGIVCKDDLIVTGGTLDITAVGDGLHGTDSVRICDGTFTIDATEDCIQSSNDTDSSKGYVRISGGNFTLSAGNDGVQAETDLTITGGNFNVITAGGSQTPTTANDMPAGGPGGGRQDMPGRMSTSSTGLSTTTTTTDTATNENDGISTAGSDPTAQNSSPALNNGMPTENSNTNSAVNNTAAEATNSTSSTEDASTSNSYKGLKAGGSLQISGGTFTISANDDAIHCNGTIQISGGNFTLAATDDGIHADSTLTIDDGSVVISQSYEGLEGYNVIVNGGNIAVTASDDGINASGGGSGMMGMGQMSGVNNGTNTDDSTLAELRITGGIIRINAGGDGVDSNGNLFIEGGEVYVSCVNSNGNGAIDSGTESGGVCQISGGIVVAAGGSGMAETFDSGSTQCSIMYTLDSTVADDCKLTVTDASGNILITDQLTNGFTTVVLSSPEFVLGKTYTVTIGNTATDIILSAISTASGAAAGTNGTGMGMPGGGAPNGMNRQGTTSNTSGSTASGSTSS